MAGHATNVGRAASATAATGDSLPEAGAADPGWKDSAVIAELVARDPLSFERLYDRWSGATYRQARAILPDIALAEQAIEELFLAVWHDPEPMLTIRRTVGESLVAAVRSRSLALLAARPGAQLSGRGLR